MSQTGTGVTQELCPQAGVLRGIQETPPAGCMEVTEHVQACDCGVPWGKARWPRGGRFTRPQATHLGKEGITPEPLQRYGHKAKGDEIKFFQE